MKPWGRSCHTGVEAEKSSSNLVIEGRRLSVGSGAVMSAGVEESRTLSSRTEESSSVRAGFTSSGHCGCPKTKKPCWEYCIAMGRKELSEKPIGLCCASEIWTSSGEERWGRQWWSSNGPFPKSVGPSSKDERMRRKSEHNCAKV